MIQTKIKVDYSKPTSKVTIGRSGYANTNFFKGKIDVLSFFNKGLNQGEISDLQSIFNAGNDLI
jgi:hypothetical protein